MHNGFMLFKIYDKITAAQQLLTPSDILIRNRQKTVFPLVVFSHRELEILFQFLLCSAFCRKKCKEADRWLKGLGSIRGVFGLISKISFTLSNYRFVIWDKNSRRYFVI